MKKLDLYWRSNPNWWEIKNHIPILKNDVPIEAQESYKNYLKQILSEEKKNGKL